jgi:four helix bundle protein
MHWSQFEPTIHTKGEIMEKRISRFEDLEVWKESMRLTGEIYRRFGNSHDYGFKDQIQRAAVSVPSNISEGYERQSNKGFVKFLFIARGSSGELRTQLYLAIDLKFIDTVSGWKLVEQTRKISAKISKLIKTRRQDF